MSWTCTYSQPESWAQANKGKTDITAGLLGKRAVELMDQRRPGQSLVVVIDGSANLWLATCRRCWTCRRWPETSASMDTAGSGW